MKIFQVSPKTSETSSRVHRTPVFSRFQTRKLRGKKNTHREKNNLQGKLGQKSGYFKPSRWLPKHHRKKARARNLSSTEIRTHAACGSLYFATFRKSASGVGLHRPPLFFLSSFSLSCSVAAVSMLRNVLSCCAFFHGRHVYHRCFYPRPRDCLVESVPLQPPLIFYFSST